MKNDEAICLVARLLLVDARNCGRGRDVELAIDLAGQVLVEQHLELAVLGSEALDVVDEVAALLQDEVVLG